MEYFAFRRVLTRTLRPHLRSPWNTFYKNHRIDGRLAVILDVEHTLPSFRDPPGTTNFSDTDYFHLQLDSHIDGYAVGFWSRPHYWFGLRVGPTPVKKGRQWITRDDVNDDPLLNAIFGGPTGTGEIRPISFSGGIRYPDIVVVVADQLAAKRLADTRGASNMPIDGRALDTFPTILETSKSPWFIAWVSPSIVQIEGPFKLSV